MSTSVVRTTTKSAPATTAQADFPFTIARSCDQAIAESI
jgi:hypothetical protein